MNFRLGGSKDRGNVIKNFEELKPGDIFFFYETVLGGDTIERKDEFEIDEVATDGLLKFNGAWKSLSQKKITFRAELADGAKEIIHYGKYIWSTYELSDEEAIRITKDTTASTSGLHTS